MDTSDGLDPTLDQELTDSYSQGGQEGRLFFLQSLEVRETEDRWLSRKEIYERAAPGLLRTHGLVLEYGSEDEALDEEERNRRLIGSNHDELKAKVQEARLNKAEADRDFEAARANAAEQRAKIAESDRDREKKRAAEAEQEIERLRAQLASLSFSSKS